jgi:nitric oxide reductase activation protein
MTKSPGKNTSNSNHDFSLKSVCWGYRDTFSKAIEGLFEKNLLGPEQEEITRQFFNTLKNAERDFFDHVLHEFLKALNPKTHWIMSIPAIFSDVTEMGIRFAESKLYYGTAFFRIFGEGGIGRSPDEVRNLMTFLKQLWEVDGELAFAFLKGYMKIVDRLTPSEIEQYIATGIQIFGRNRKSALRFMECTLRSSESTIEALSKECRLKDITEPLTRLLRALVGWDVEISDLGALDTDHLIERGSRVVCLYRWLYLPQRIRSFEDREANTNLYLLMAISAAGMLSENSFSRIHGHSEYTDCRSLAGEDTLRINLFQILEYVRVLSRIRAKWPGAVRLLYWAILTEFERRPPQTPAEMLFYSVMQPELLKETYPAVRELVLEKALHSASVFETASTLSGEWLAHVVSAYPGIDRIPLPPFSFLPDLLYPAEVSSPQLDRIVVDLKDESHRRAESKAEQSEPPHQDTEPESTSEEDLDKRNKEERPKVEARYIYDEWSQPDNDYLRNHCFLREIDAVAGPKSPLPSDFAAQVKKTRRIFEYLKPSVAKKEKYLQEGDMINPDLLIEYLTLKHREPSPKIRFYEKPRINRRDLAVLILMDVSGSTGNEAENYKILELEKYSALILGQGLESLGDKFSICGFSGQGRENCEFYVFKDFQEKWDSLTMSRVLRARPRSSTRIGVALRHAGYRLAKAEAKQRLIILITDGKPMDSGYDPATRYAQYDIRMSCEENKRQGIHTFGISTEENTRADMQIMFPGGRFAILPDIRHLPRVLPRLYVKLTI